ncbi:hypothetical protein R2B_p016 [Ralstonia phage DU_RP_II]|nr:hypothetical protein R2B_p016 [Ralstonia phage DU_RP_II]
MTIQSQTTRVDYTGNGATTNFPVPFYWLQDADLLVIRTDNAYTPPAVATLALTTDYVVAGSGNQSGGSITTTVAPTATQKLSILRNVPFTQLTHYVPNDPFPAASHEQALDKLTMETQQLNEGLSRSLTLPPNVTAVSTNLPAPVASNLIGWNPTANALQNVDLTTIATSVTYGNAKGDLFSGNGATVNFNLSANPGGVNNLDVSIGGVAQRPGIDYNWTAGTTLTFTTAPPSGTNNILVRYTQALPIGTAAAGNVAFDNTTLDQQFLRRVNRVVDSIAALRGLSKTTYTRAFVTGYYAAGDGGGGAYWYDPTDTTSTDNGGTIIVAADGGRWKLIITTSFVSAKQFGAKIDGVTDDSTVINNAKAPLDALGKRLYFPAGICKIGTAIMPPLAGVFGDSPQSSVILCNGVSAFNFPSTFGLGRPACLIEKLGIKSYNNTCDGLFAFNAPGVASGAAVVYNSGLTVRDVEIGTGGRFGGAFSLKDFFRVNIENVGCTDVSQVINLAGSVVQCTFRNITANGDNAPTILQRTGLSTTAATYSSGLLTPEHISCWDCSFIRFNIGVNHQAGLMIDFNQMDMETFQYGFYLRAACNINGGIINPAPNSAGTAAWIGVFKDVQDFEITNGAIIDGLDVNALNVPGTPGSSYGMVIGNGVNKCVGTTIKNCRFRGSASSFLSAISAPLMGGEIILENNQVSGTVATGTTFSVTGASYARVVGNRCATGGTVNGSMSITDSGAGTVGTVLGNEFATITNTVNAYSGAWAPGTIANLVAASTTVAVPGAIAGDRVVAGLSSLIGSGNCIISGYVSSSGNVTVMLLNASGGSQTIPSGTLSVSVIKP